MPCPLGCGSSFCAVDAIFLRLVFFLTFCLHTFLIYLQALSWERYLTRSITCSLESLFRVEGEVYQWLSIHRVWILFITNLQRNLWWETLLFFGVAKVAGALGSSFGHCPPYSTNKITRHMLTFILFRESALRIKKATMKELFFSLFCLSFHCFIFSKRNYYLKFQAYMLQNLN